MKNFIAFNNVKKIYNEHSIKKIALNGIDFNIKKGEFVVILGPSGAGKSTLLNLLGTMDKVSSGEIFINGEKISDYSDNKLAKFRAENIGFIFQSSNIFSTLTVYENIEIAKDIVKKSKDSIKVLREVGLIKDVNKFPYELSIKEQQKVSIARAMVKNFEILLADEPTGELDSKEGVEVLKLLKKINDNGNTMVIATHNPLIAEIADHVINLKNGKIDSDKLNKKKKNIDEVQW